LIVAGGATAGIEDGVVFQLAESRFHGIEGRTTATQYVLPDTQRGL
jgi:hypothetical protein